MVQLAKLVLFGTLWPATMRERHLMLVAWMSHPPSLAPLASQGLHNSSPMTGHNKETTPHGLALLDQAWFNTSWPAITRERHLMLLALMSQPLALLTWPSRARMAGHHSRRQDQIGFFQGLRSNGFIFRGAETRKERKRREERTRERVFGWKTTCLSEEFLIQGAVKVGFGSWFELDRAGAPTTPWQRTTVSDLLAILDAILWRVGAADCEMWNGHHHGFWKIVSYLVLYRSALGRVWSTILVLR
ncbi:hypothetical protein TIFTF001_027758 [Ficus carica]|uniref:Uncharacterized protein n=1 Tax=Ficus carica TaxID=3494 RepID=A0AA88IVK3_FICCA|nr:hypothetical protein TIFTF001_027758 [Ficus carica]